MDVSFHILSCEVIAHGLDRIKKFEDDQTHAWLLVVQKSIEGQWRWCQSAVIAGGEQVVVGKKGVCGPPCTGCTFPP